MRMLLDELYQEEAEQKGYEKEQTEIAKRARMREDMIKANEYQMALKAKLAEEQAVEEEKFRQQMLQKFAEDKRLEQMNAARRQREMENYKKEVERLVEERRRVFEESVRSELEELRSKQEQESYRQAVIERERARLLAEHATDLQEHLPKGVLRNPNDFEMVYGRAPAFDEDKEERDLIASRNTGIPVGKPRNDSRASAGRRSEDDYGSRPGSNYGNRRPPSDSGGYRQSPRRASPRQSPSASRPASGRGRFGQQSSSASNIFGDSPRNNGNSRQGSRRASRQDSRQSNRSGFMEDSKPPPDRPF